jgi:protoheme IX farnesyltransferase
MRNYADYAPGKESSSTPAAAYSRGRAELFMDVFRLMKPGIVALVMVSTLTGLYFGSAAEVEFILIFKTLAGIGLATAGAAVLNNYLDRDIDSLMQRTAKRALVKGSINPADALLLSAILLLTAFAILITDVNALAAAFTALAVFTYIVLYGMVLKRRSSYANQIGGLAGALPPVIGYVAVTNTLSIEAFALFLIVAVWQQPHALSLALRYKDDYAKANVPVVPVVKGVFATKLRIAIYSLILLPVSILPFVLGMAGYGFLIATIIAGTLFAFFSIRFLLSNKDRDMKLFFYSIVYLTAVFLAMVVDMNV